MFTPIVQRHVACPEAEAPGCTVREVQSALRRHMTIFVDGQIIRDRARLADPVPLGWVKSRIHIASDYPRSEANGHPDPAFPTNSQQQRPVSVTYHLTSSPARARERPPQALGRR